MTERVEENEVEAVDVDDEPEDITVDSEVWVVDAIFDRVISACDLVVATVLSIGGDLEDNVRGLVLDVAELED